MDSRIFNYFIMFCYGINSLWWAYRGSWADVAYWAGALWITAAVTFGYNH